MMPVREIVETNRFRRDFKKISASGKFDLADFKIVINFLINDIPLPKKYHDHALTGDKKYYRECHIKPDWLLIYQKQEKILLLIRTGSHSELF